MAVVPYSGQNATQSPTSIWISPLFKRHCLLNCSLLLWKIELVALKVYIPRHVILSAHLCIPYCQSIRKASFVNFGKDHNPLKYFSEDQDTKNLRSLLELLDVQARKDLPHFVQEFCSLCDAMPVHNGSLMQGTKENLPWNELSSFYPAINQIRQINSKLADYMEEKAQKSILHDHDLLRCMLKRHTCQLQKEFLELNYYRAASRKYFEEKCVQDSPDGDLMMLRLLARSSFTEEIQSIIASDQLDHKSKCAAAESKWKEQSIDEGLCAQVLASEPLQAIVRELERTSEALTSLDKECQKLQHKSSLKAGAPLRGALESLYEYSRLKAVLRMIALDGEADGYVRLFVAIGEALTGKICETTFGIPRARSLGPLRSAIKEIRDFFEHPENYYFILFGNETKEAVETRLFQQIHALKRFIQERVTRLEKTLLPHEQKEVSALFEAFTEVQQNATTEGKVSKEGKKLVLEQRDRALFHELGRIIIDFKQRITFSFKPGDEQKKRSDVDNKIRSKDWEPYHLEKAGATTNYVFAHPQGIWSYDELFRGMDKVAKEAQNAVSGCVQVSLEQAQIPKRKLQFEALLCQFFRLLSQLRSCTEYQSHPQRSKLEALYVQLREARGYVIHDLWRDSSVTTVNALHLIASEYPIHRPEEPLALAPYNHTCLELDIVNKIVQGREDSVIIDALQAPGLQVNFQDYKGRTLLHFATCYERENVAKRLLALGANPHIGDSRGSKPLHYACEVGNMGLVELFLQNGAVPTSASNRGSPRDVALAHERLEVADYLMQFEGNNREVQAQALLQSVQTINVERVRSILANGGLHPTIRIQGKVPLVELCQIKEADPAQRLEVAELLINSGADVEQQDADGRCSLHAAAENSLLEDMCSLLLSKASNVSIQDACGSTPLHYAIYTHSLPWARALLKAGASVQLEDSINGTPLMAACNIRGDYDGRIAKLLLSYGSNPNEGNQYGTALHYATELGKMETVNALLRAGASPLTPGYGGKYYGKTLDAIARDECHMPKQHGIIFEINRWSNYILQRLA